MWQLHYLLLLFYFSSFTHHSCSSYVTGFVQRTVCQWWKMLEKQGIKPWNTDREPPVIISEGTESKLPSVLLISKGAPLPALEIPWTLRKCPLLEIKAKAGNSCRGQTWNCILSGQTPSQVEVDYISCWRGHRSKWNHHFHLLLQFYCSRCFLLRLVSPGVEWKQLWECCHFMFSVPVTIRWI